MDAQIITESELLERLQAHAQWLHTSASFDARPAQGAQLSLRQVTLSDLHLTRQSFSASELVGCQIRNSTFENCDFSYALLIDCVLENCAFLGCNFVKADLRSADCQGSNFAESDFTRADFTEANLSYANLSGCILNWAWLAKTDLRNARLDKIQLKGARLLRAKLYNTQRFQLESLEDVLVENIYIAPDGNGEPRSGHEALLFLQK